MLEYQSISALCAAAEEAGVSLSELVLRDQAEEMELPAEVLYQRMRENLQVMRQAIQAGSMPETRSLSGLTGGDAFKMKRYAQEGGIIGGFMNRSIARALAVSEYNAAMGKVVASPTAGSCGILPGTVVSMLEEGNDFVRRYNEMTGAEVTATFVDGCPYFFGGKADDETTLTRLFSRAPLYSKREIWEQTRFYDKGSYYLYGLDCSGFTQWVYAEAGLPKHDSLSNMILQYGKYGKNHVYSHRKGKGMPSYDKLAENLQVGDLLVAKKRARHIMMFIGTLRDFGYTEEELPELAPYLDYALVIHCGPNFAYTDRIQAFLDAHQDDSYYKGVKTTDGGVAISIIGVPFEDAPNRGSYGVNDFAWFDMPDGYKLTIWDLPNATSFCWFRMNP